MKLVVIVLLAVAFSTIGAHAQERKAGVTVAELQKNNVQPLPREEMEKLLRGAHIRHETVAGSTRTWINGQDGTLVRLTSNGAAKIGPSVGSGGEGTWTINERGEYCVNIVWSTAARPTESWCRLLLPYKGVYYGINHKTLANPSAEAGAYTIEATASVGATATTTTGSLAGGSSQ